MTSLLLAAPQVLTLVAKLPSKCMQLLVPSDGQKPQCVDFRAMHPHELEALQHYSSDIITSKQQGTGSSGRQAGDSSLGFWREVLLQVALAQALPPGSLQPRSGLYFFKLDMGKVQEGGWMGAGAT